MVYIKFTEKEMDKIQIQAKKFRDAFDARVFRPIAC